jgi:hypothetical protein
LAGAFAGAGAGFLAGAFAGAGAGFFAGAAPFLAGAGAGAGAGFFAGAGAFAAGFFSGAAFFAGAFGAGFFAGAAFVAVFFAAMMCPPAEVVTRRIWSRSLVVKEKNLTDSAGSFREKNLLGPQKIRLKWPNR